MTTTGHDLPRLLANARRWFDEALTEAMRDTGEQPVSPPQVGLFAVLDDDGTTVSELARRMGVARQTVHQAVHGLVDAGLLEQVPDPGSARQRLIRRTTEGERIHRRALAVLDRLERTLAERIGAEKVEALRSALEAPWGPPPTTPAP
ncbi:MarR family winged helix-turn-helix transcriptional regulator [Actinomadura opuntiae]|uniref:MarR family winged helix-turn-helix transcriptional regulator n=1 Tax=Actinomadura sp. OS1-43 TaxID=604315 RepID=UPI00255A94A1|nr:MarR family winged helix-turn-helix transcriptional regulator [Actinomadura sp. OS1-43]MDL4815622.1 MarR family winged helix-turn-helix transcriptional regulator [Actinomadura sp. OS1-43]